MLHPSYSDLMEAVNEEADGDTPIVNSRYSIVIATAKRARQIVAGDRPLVEGGNKKKPLSAAIDELYAGEVKILVEDADSEEETGNGTPEEELKDALSEEVQSEAASEENTAEVSSEEEVKETQEESAPDEEEDSEEPAAEE